MPNREVLALEIEKSPYMRLTGNVMFWSILNRQYIGYSSFEKLEVSIEKLLHARNSVRDMYKQSMFPRPLRLR